MHAHKLIVSGPAAQCVKEVCDESWHVLPEYEFEDNQFSSRITLRPEELTTRCFFIR